MLIDILTVMTADIACGSMGTLLAGKDLGHGSRVKLTVVIDYNAFWLRLVR